MKITKKQLKRIIQEENARIVAESRSFDQSDAHYVGGVKMTGPGADNIFGKRKRDDRSIENRIMMMDADQHHDLIVFIIEKAQYTLKRAGLEAAIEEGMANIGIREALTSMKIPKAKYDPSLPPATSEEQWLDWAEGYGMFPEFDNDGQMLFYYMMDDDVDGSITSEAEFLGGAIEPAPYPSQTTMIYTGVYR